MTGAPHDPANLVSNPDDAMSTILDLEDSVIAPTVARVLWAANTAVAESNLEAEARREIIKREASDAAYILGAANITPEDMARAREASAANLTSIAIANAELARKTEKFRVARDARYAASKSKVLADQQRILKLNRKE